MATTVSPDLVAHDAPSTADATALRTGAVGFLSNVAIGVSSTAPAYSMGPYFDRKPEFLPLDHDQELA